MPGIVGIISQTAPEACSATLSEMVREMHHEPFYRSGTFTHEGLGLYAGWVCHKGSFADCMPVWNENKDILMIFSGENFIDPSAMNRLKSGKHGLKLQNHDASYLVHLYEEDEDRFYRGLNGWFSGIIMDLRKPAVVLFNDRFGVHRLYYLEHGDGFMFSSEAKSLLKVRPSLREIDPKGMGELFSCGCVLEDRSLFKDLRILPGGSAWTFVRGPRPETRQYFRAEEWENAAVLDRKDFGRMLKDTLGRIIPRYLQGNQPIGISLTGGLDSRILMAYLDGNSANVSCYTFGGESRDSLDVKISRQVAMACKREHSVLRLGGDFLRRFGEEAEKTVYISDGTLDACGCYELYLNAKARQIAPVRLTGNWGSELLRGARAFKATLPYRKIFDPEFYGYIEEATRTFARISSAPDLTFSLFKQAPWHSYGRLSVEQSQLTQRTPYMDKDFAQMVYRARKEDRSSDRLSLWLLGETNPRLLGIRTDRGAGGNSGAVASWFWRSCYEAAFKAEYYCGHGMPKWLSRWDKELKYLHYDRLLLGRNKFHNFRQWFRDDLAGYLRSMLLDSRTLGRPFLNGRSVEEMTLNHIRGHENYLEEINYVLTVELVHRLFLD